MPAARVNGSRVEKVWAAADTAISRARNGLGPSFIQATCTHIDGHFLGDPLLRIFEEPVKQMTEITGPLVGSAIKTPGARVAGRIGSLSKIGVALGTMGMDRYVLKRDPLLAAERLLPEDVCSRLDSEATTEVEKAVSEALETKERESHV